MSDYTEPKPCPFCGGRAEPSYSGVDVFCCDCEATMPANKWNSRPFEDALNRRIDQLIVTAEQSINTKDPNAYFDWLRLIHEIRKERGQ